MTLNPTDVDSNVEFYKIPAPINTTINELLEKTKNQMGPKYYGYSASSNNCQYFISAIITSNNINRGLDFVKQATESIFENNPNLRKLTNTITDLGNRVDIIQQGGQIHKMNYKLSSTSKSFPTEAGIRFKRIN